MLGGERPQMSSGSSMSGTPSDPPLKRRLGRPRKGSSIEHPIEIDSVPKTQRAAVDKKKNGRSKKPSPALSQSSGSSSSSSSRSHPSVMQRKGSPGPIQSFPGHPLWTLGGILPPNIQQYPQAVTGTANPYHQQPAQLQTPGAMLGRLAGTAQLRQYTYSMTPPPPAPLQPSFASGSGSSVAINRQQFSQGTNHIHLQQPQYASNTWFAPEKFGPLRPPHKVRVPIRPANLSHHPQVARDTTNANYQQFELKPGACGLPSAGLSFNECLNPDNGVNLVDLDPEQIVCGWLENWQSRGLLNGSIEGSLFKRHA